MKGLGFRGNESLLDIGCGTGQYSQMTNGPYLGIDLSKSYIEYAQKTYPDKDFIFMNVADLKSDRPFEAVLLVDTIHHLSDEQSKTLLTEIVKTQPEKIYFFEPITPPKSNWLGRIVAGADRGQFIRPRKQLLELIEKYFDIQKVLDFTIMWVEGVGVLCKIKK